MTNSGECLAAGESGESVEGAALATLSGLRHCLRLAEIALEHGLPGRAAEHVLGALEDLAPELAVLAKHRRP